MTAAAEASAAPALPPRSGFVLGSLIVAFVVTVAYWVIWFFVDRAILASANTESYYVFENAFPVADTWLAVTALLGAIALRKRRATTLLWCLCAGSASLYLAGMDILFDLENGIYKAPTGDWGGVVVEALINAGTLFIGAYVVHWTWKHRRTLAALEGF
ncbi:MAG: hypothetical protein JST54_03920 [Deltaproteobacteria bacterium]|nr:hypothetical protein [Deltaproteobacteria bacterium]